MKSSDLVLFKETCDSIHPDLYNTLQTPDASFRQEVESGEYFVDKHIKYDFDERENILEVSLRYYQRLALFFTQHYFNHEYLVGNNTNNKLTYWMATGSGKTIIMKANIIDYFEYLRDKNPSEIEVIITSPLKELIEQLRKEMRDFFSHPFFRDFRFNYKIETTQGLSKQNANEYDIVGNSQYRLLLVDEAHIGLKTSTDKEKGAFVALRDNLTKNTTNSFMFEYSATFYDITEKEKIDEYANRIVFEYDYGKFYNDGYGKDFKFGVVKKDSIAEDENQDIKRNLDVNIEEFHKKIQAFNQYNKTARKDKQFTDRPLLVMAGNTVNKNKESKADNPENSDIAKIVDYFANLKDPENYKDVFHTGRGALHLLLSNTGRDEILLSYGEDSIPFGLITVGDVKSFLKNTNIEKLVSDNKIILKTVKFADKNHLFKHIDYPASPINILIGSRKFSAGWNSFRVSQICLINFGSGVGSTIVQIFGRGVRLKGLSDDGKRQEDYVDEENGERSGFKEYTKHSNLSPDAHENLKYLETLFIYSLRSTYLTKFIEEDTDIYRKNVLIVKKVEKTNNRRVNPEKKLPIFHIDRTFSLEENKVECTLVVESGKMRLDYQTDSISNTTTLQFPIRVDLSIESKNIVGYESYGHLVPFIDKSYLQSLLERKARKNNILFHNLSIDFIIKMLKNTYIEVVYDDIIVTPKQVQKLLTKVQDTLVSKVIGKIKYVESNTKYKFNEEISPEDYIEEYFVKITLKDNGKIEETKERLSGDDSYKIFTQAILNHLYQPLAIDPISDTKKVYKSFNDCGYPKLTQNFQNIFESEEEYFKGVESINISPDKLNQYEFKFLCDLQKHISDNNLYAIVLRNKSNGNIGIILEEGVFYPDFIIWYEDEKHGKHLIFCDPKGIRNVETKWKVSSVPKETKKIQAQCKAEVSLHSFIISRTPLVEIKWEPIVSSNLDKCYHDWNLVFFEDEGYIEKIFKKVKDI